jgi:hypothetical protein
MAAITLADWGRIYAFIWRELKNGNELYKNEFEKDPKHAIDHFIKPALKKEGVDLHYDTIFDIDSYKPADLDTTQLDAIVKGEAVAFFQVRLSC